MYRCIRRPFLQTLGQGSKQVHIPKSFASTEGLYPKSKPEPKPAQIDSKAIGSGKASPLQIGFNIVLFCGGLYLISDFIFNTQYKNTGAYKMSQKLLENSYEVTSRIGLPIIPYYKITGRRYGGNNLFLQWKVYGPGGDATIVCRNTFVGGKGSIVELSATFEDDTVVNLVKETDPVRTEKESDDQIDTATNKSN